MQKYFIFTIIIIHFSCLNPFAPGLTSSGDQSSILTAQKTPEEVLTNFRYAYVFRDSLTYSDVLDSSFLFISKNYSTTPPTNLNWGRDVDIKTTIGLFRHYNVLELNWGEIRAPYPETDTIEMTSRIKLTFQLTLDGGRDVPTIKGEADFKFVKNSAGIWRISRWEDLSSF
jgi:hypothetical protein